MDLNSSIVIPMQSVEAKILFEYFIETKTGKYYKVGTQYKNGLVMEMVSIDLKEFSAINMVCGAWVKYRTHGVKDFIERYAQIVEDYKNKNQCSI